MKIIDSQLHCWYPNTPSRPWPDGAVSLHGLEYTIEQANTVLDGHGVQGAVLVPRVGMVGIINTLWMLQFRGLRDLRLWDA